MLPLEDDVPWPQKNLRRISAMQPIPRMLQEDLATVLYTEYLSPAFTIGNPAGMIPAYYLSVNSQATYLLNFSN
jgi:hypothetical protein